MSGPKGAFINCPHCGKQHPVATRFCPVTGDRLVQVPPSCPNCGQLVPAGVKFCPFCATRLATDYKLPPVPPSPFESQDGHRPRLTLFGAVALMILALAGAGGYWWLSQQGLIPFKEGKVDITEELPPKGTDQNNKNITSQDVVLSSPTLYTGDINKIGTGIPTALEFNQTISTPPVTPEPSATILPSSHPPITTPTSVLLPAPTSTEATGLIAFNSNRAGNNDIYVMKTDGSDVIQLTSGRSDDRVPSWSPDGRQIAFQSNEGGDYEITIYDLRSRRERRVTINNCDDYNPVWSPDGEWFAFYSDCDGNREIYTIRIDGSERRQLTRTSQVYNWFPNWSPDGQQITFSSNRSWKYEVFIMDADGSGTRSLARGCVSAFSPDGSWLVFAQYCTDTGQIYMIRSDGTNLHTLIEEENNANPSWSSNGEWVLFQSDRTGNEEIWMINLDRGDLEQLTFDDGRDSAGVWQPVPGLVP